MEHFIAWCGFVGGWLLVAGPVSQAAQELGELELERDRIAEAGAKVPKPEPVSSWWWLAPPVKMWLEHKHGDTYRDAYIAAQLPEDVEALMGFFAKAQGWLLVGAGGTLIATKETWELCEIYEWSTAVFWVLTVVMLSAALLFTALREGRKRRIIAQRS